MVVRRHNRAESKITWQVRDSDGLWCYKSNAHTVLYHTNRQYVCKLNEQTLKSQKQTNWQTCEQNRDHHCSTSRKLLSSAGKVHTLHNEVCALKSHLMRTQSLKVHPLKPGVGQYIATHPTLTARDFFLAYFYLPVHSPAFFPKNLPIFPELAVANTGYCVGPQNKIGHPVGCRFPCWVPAEYK